MNAKPTIQTCPQCQRHTPHTMPESSSKLRRIGGIALLVLSCGFAFPVWFLLLFTDPDRQWHCQECGHFKSYGFLSTRNGAITMIVGTIALFLFIGQRSDSQPEPNQPSQPTLAAASSPSPAIGKTPSPTLANIPDPTPAPIAAGEFTLGKLQQIGGLNYFDAYEMRLGEVYLVGSSFPVVPRAGLNDVESQRMASNDQMFQAPLGTLICFGELRSEYYYLATLYEPQTDRVVKGWVNRSAIVGPGTLGEAPEAEFRRFAEKISDNKYSPLQAVPIR